MSSAVTVLLASLLAASAADHGGSQVLRLPTPALPPDFALALDLDVWAHNPNFTDVMVTKSQLPRVRAILQKNGIVFDIIIENVQAMINHEKAAAVMDDDSESVRDKGRFQFDKYHKLSEIHDYLDWLADNYSDIVTVGVMGYSHFKRPLKYVKISSSKPDAKAFFIDGGIHAREWISPAVILYMIDQLVEKRHLLPQALLDLDFYIVPVLNPDGYHYTFTSNRLWRKNRSKRYRGCRGVDLNRNFGFKWGGNGTSGKGCSEIFRGRAPFSEPESRALAEFIAAFSNDIEVYLTLHSYSQLILLPYGYDSVLPEDFEELKRAGEEAAEAMLSAGGELYHVGNSVQLLYPAGGNSVDWAKGEIGIKYAYTMELRDTGRYGFLLPAKQILPTAKEAFEAVKVFAKAAITAS